MKIAKPEGYTNLLNDIKSILQKGLGRAYKAVDNIKVQTYWQIGERIAREELQNKRADYGKRVVELLADDIKCSRALMFEIIQFYRAYPIVHALYGQLTWSQYRVLIKLNEKERAFYEQLALQNIWSVRELKKSIKNLLYSQAKREGKLTVNIPIKRATQPERVFKDTYHFDFLGLKEEHSEKELEEKALNKIEKVLLEFGYGFAFVARQKSVLIAGKKHRIDLLFYHIPLGCFVVVELKTGRFQEKFVGQVNKYLTFLKEKEMYDYMRDPIGLIICKEKDEEEVHYALGKLKQEIFVSEYRTRLPSEQEIKSRLR